MIANTTRNRIYILTGILLVGLFIHPSKTWAEPNAIGTVKTVNDHAFIIRGDARIPCQVGDTIFQHDALETDETGSLGVTLKDNTRLSLGPKSHLTVREFIFNPQQEEYSLVTEMIRGTLVYLSGIIAKLSPESVSIKTPTATVGIRGTRLVIRIDHEEDHANQEG
ncbi:FecR family protein [Nitrospira sp. M1]